MKQYRRFWVMVVMAALAVVASVQTLSAQEPSVTSRTFQSSRYDFTFSYPADWNVENPVGDGGYETITLTRQDERTAYSISLGYYMLGIEPAGSIEQWVSDYPNEFKGQTEIIEQYDAKVAGREAFYVYGRSPITEYQFTVIRSGEVAMFVWANFGDGQSQAALTEVISTLDIGPNSPTTLQEVFGEGYESPNWSTASASGPEPFADGLWDVPVYGSWTVNCGSSYHTNGAAHAMDIAANYYTEVYASRGGSISFSGWNNDGYGNLVKVNTGGYYHMYGHLHTIHTGNFTAGWYIGEDVGLGQVGNTGGVPTHLHFHIHTGHETQSSASPVNPVGLVNGFSANGLFPSGWGVCGSTSR